MKGLLRIDDFLKNKVITNFKISKDKKNAIFFVNTMDIKENSYKKIPYIMDTKTKAYEEIEIPFFADDFQIIGNNVFFKIIKERNTYIHEYDLNFKQINNVIKIPYPINWFHINNNRIYFTTKVKNINDNYFEIGNFLPFRREGSKGFGDQYTNLFFFDEELSAIVDITKGEVDIDDIVFDKENQRILMTGFPVGGVKPIASDVYKIDLNNYNLTKLTNGEYRISYVESFSENEVIFYGLDLAKYNRNDNKRLYKIKLDIEEIIPFGPDLETSDEWPSITTDSVFGFGRPVTVENNKFYFVTTGRYGAILNKIDINGNLENFDIDIRTIDSYAILDEGIILAGLKNNQLHELYYYDYRTIIQISNFNGWLSHECILSTPKKLVFTNKEGIEIDGWVIPPPQLEGGKKYPGILMIHGGPKRMYTDVFSHDMQLLAANGYFVFYANPRGSDGRGNDFLNIRGKYAKAAFDDLMEFTEEVLKKYPMIDPEVLGITGGSYGGFMTNYIITQTDRFKAAVSERSICNMISVFNTSDIGYQYLYEYMDNLALWESPEDYIAISPIMKAHGVTTPTLFIHGKEDSRCHYTESLQMYSALKYHGVKSSICLFEGEDHSLSVYGRPKTKRKRYELLLQWFDNFLRKEVVDGASRTIERVD